MAETDTPTPAKSNGYDPELVKSFVARIVTLQGDLASMKGSYMAECKSVRGDITTVLDEASDKGIPKKALKAVLKIHALEKQAEAAREDSGAADDIDMIRHALGELADTPLGQAATGAA